MRGHTCTHLLLSVLCDHLVKAMPAWSVVGRQGKAWAVDLDAQAALSQRADEGSNPLLHLQAYSLLTHLEKTGVG